MKFSRLWAIARKEFLHVFRDARSLYLALAIPLLLLTLFGFALTLDVNNVPLILWDQDETPTSRELIAAFNGSRYFKIVEQTGDYRRLVRAIDSGDALVALVIPRGFEGNLKSGGKAPLQFIVDGSDPNTAQIATGYAQSVTTGYSSKVVMGEATKLFGRPPRPAVDFLPRVWFNTELESKNFIIPGIIAVIMMILAGLLTSLTIAREWERGTMEQLISTPVRAHELVLGKFIPYFLIGLADVLLVVLVGQFVFHVPLRGSVALLFGMGTIFLTASLAIGMLVSVVAKTQLMANQMAMLLTFMPSFLLSGFMFAISNMPKPLQVISAFVPATYFIRILRGIYLKGIGLEVFGMEAAVLAVFALAMVLLANAKFKRKLE